MILTCLKTGRWWRCHDDAHARRLARNKGLVDYEVTQAAPGKPRRHPATSIGE